MRHFSFPKGVLSPLQGTMNQKCPYCTWTGATGREVADHRHTRHGVQQVICPYYRWFSLHQTPSSLKRHIRSQHHKHDDRMLATGMMYYFAAHSMAYRSIMRDVPSIDSEVVLRAQAALRRWRDIMSSMESAWLPKPSETGPNRNQRTKISSWTWQLKCTDTTDKLVILNLMQNVYGLAVVFHGCNTLAWMRGVGKCGHHNRNNAS